LPIPSLIVAVDDSGIGEAVRTFRCEPVDVDAVVPPLIPTPEPSIEAAR
jgi:hypothetical protein